MRRAEAEPGTAAWTRKLLHDLSQPLTALECRLVVGTMEDEGSSEASAKALRDAVRESLVECQRLMEQMRAAQEELWRLR